MDNYLLMGHILQCKVIPKDKVHPELWIGANKKWRKIPWDRVVRVSHHKVNGHQLMLRLIFEPLYVQPRTEEGIRKAEKRLMRRQRERKRKLEEAGIQYNFDAVSYVSVVISLIPPEPINTVLKQKKKPKSS